MSIRAATLLTTLIITSSIRAGDQIASTYRDDLAGAVQKKLLADIDWLLPYYLNLHRNPELSSAEKESAGRIAEKLRSQGYDVTTGVGGYGVVGMLHNGPGPTVLVRGDMDALPIVEETGLDYASKVSVKRDDGHIVGVMHACGHDIHQTCLVGTAGMLADFRDKWSGTVMIVAQPAEEIGAGARLMLDDGLFERFAIPDYSLALHVSASHPAGVIAYTPGWALANVDSVDVTIYGRGGHGSRPHEAIDPVLMASQTVVSLQSIVSRRLDPKEPGVITVGSIHAGSKHNIIPDIAKLQITVRSYADDARKVLLDGIREVTVNTCRAMGATKDPDVVLREEEFTPSTYNDPALTAAGVEVFKKALGPDRVVERDPVMGGEDFSRYSRRSKHPGFIFWLGSVPQSRYDASKKTGGQPLPSLHSSKYYPDPIPTIETGVTAMTSLTLSLLGTK